MQTDPSIFAQAVTVPAWIFAALLVGAFGLQLIKTWRNGGGPGPPK